MDAPIYALQHMPANLRVVDTPLTYTPTVGPAVRFRVTYNQRDGSQPQIYSYGNLGPAWTKDALSWVSDNPNSIDVQADVYLRGGGVEHYRGGAGTGVYTPHWRSRAVLAKVSTTPVRYERQLPDGGVEGFAQPEGVITFGRHVYLTDITDPQGLTLHLTYDASFRIVALTDATGLVTTLAYELASDPLKLTKMTDPYGRVATLTYNAAGELASLTDALTLTSSFIQATDPLGATERVEFRYSTTDIAATAPATQVPPGSTPTTRRSITTTACTGTNGRWPCLQPTSRRRRSRIGWRTCMSNSRPSITHTAFRPRCRIASRCRRRIACGMRILGSGVRAPSAPGSG